MALTKEKMIELMATRRALQMDHDKSRAALETLIEIIKSELEQGQEVKIHKFGKWFLQEKEGRTGRDPNTDEKIVIAAHRRVQFKASKNLREAVLSRGQRMIRKEEPKRFFIHRKIFGFRDKHLRRRIRDVGCLS